jgi:hypothetical protein
MITEDLLHCPRCKQVDSTQKVSAIVAEGITTAQYQSIVPIKWGSETNYFPVQRELVTSTILAQKLMLPSKPEEDDRKLLLWRIVHHKWEQLYYCRRCDGVFIQGQPRFVPVDQLHNYLQEEKENYCLIQQVRVGSPLNLQVKFRLSANAIKDDRVYSIRQKDWQEGFISSHIHPSNNCAKCKQAFDELIRQMESDGWQVIEKGEQVWYLWLFVKVGG